MLQPVPLRARLRVQVHRVVVPDKALLAQVLDRVLHRDASETGERNVVQRPVQLHARARLDLVARAPDDGVRQKVEGCLLAGHADEREGHARPTAELIPLPIAVKKPPQRAAGPALGRGQVVEARKHVRLVGHLVLVDDVLPEKGRRKKTKRREYPTRGHRTPRVPIAKAQWSADAPRRASQHRSGGEAPLMLLRRNAEVLAEVALGDEPLPQFEARCRRCRLTALSSPASAVRTIAGARSTQQA